MYKIKFTDKSKANLWIYLDLAKFHRLKGLTSPYIISYLHLLNLNNILTLPRTLVFAEAGFGLTQMMFALFFDCQICMHARKTNASSSCLFFPVHAVKPSDFRFVTWFMSFLKFDLPRL